MPTWEIGSTCDTKKWESETACFGVWHPWIVVPLKEPTRTAKGQLQAYHWLADESPDDPTKVFTINYDDALTMLIWESLTPSPVQPDLSHLAKVFMDHSDNDSKTDPAVTNYGHSYDLTCDYATAQNNWGFSTHNVAGASGLLSVAAVFVGFAVGLF